MEQVLEVHSRNPAHTREYAAALAPWARPGFVLCLDGELGAGKTTFIAGLAAALGSPDEVLSPTFTLENRYALNDRARPALRELLHVDLYRPGADARRDLLPSMLDARDEGAVLAVEWAEPVQEELEPYLRVGLRLERGSAASDPHRILKARPVPEGWIHFAELAAIWRRIERETA
jgi:tRNA threonylcarbamoyladenosine biosynthesis protein TsaE